MAKTVGRYDENESVYRRDAPYTQDTTASTETNESWALG